MDKVKYRPFKYRGQKFLLTENQLDFIPGFRIRKDGIILISISKCLPIDKRNLELHRLITKRGLRNMRFRKVEDIQLNPQGEAING